MRPKRVAVTGIGAVSAAGIGLEPLRAALVQGTVCAAQADVLEGTPFAGRPARGVPGFDAKAILGVKGLRYLNRASLLACAAARLAFEDAGVAQDDVVRDVTGVALGTAFANFRAECEFSQVAASMGHRSLDPLAFPNTVVSTPAGHVALMFRLGGFNGTVSSGEAAGLDAVILAARHVCMGRAALALAGGVEDLSSEGYARVLSLGALAEADGLPATAAPFDRRRTGVVPGEGCAFVLLEELEHARERGARVYAEIKGYASGFDVERCRLYRRGEDPFAAGPATAVRVLQAALADAATSAAEVDHVSAAASGSPQADRVEAAAIAQLFGGRPPAVSACKGALGETVGAAGAFQTAAAALECREGWIAPTAGYEEADPACGLASVLAQARYGDVRNVLVHGHDPSGLDSALVVGRAELVGRRGRNRRESWTS